MSYIFYAFKLVLLLLIGIPNLSQAKSSKMEQHPLIVLFHGLGNNAASFNTMKHQLVKSFSDDAVLSLMSTEGMNSINFSIKQQAEMNFKELSSNHLKDLSHRPMLLVGHSQGGLRAYAFMKQYEHCFNIKGLVTIDTPWEGAPGARVDTAMLMKGLKGPVLSDLRKLSLSLGYAKTTLEKQLMLSVAANQSVCLCPGGKDLIEHSPFLFQVGEWISNEKKPILAIGGGGGDFRALLPGKKTHKLEHLNKIYTFWVVGEKGLDKHDMQVPLYSQHAVHIAPKSMKNFQRVFIKDAFHSSHVWTVPVPKSKAVLAHPRVLNSIIKFAKSILK